MNTIYMSTCEYNYMKKVSLPAASFSSSLSNSHLSSQMLISYLSSFQSAWSHAINKGFPDLVIGRAKPDIGVTDAYALVVLDR